MLRLLSSLYSRRTINVNVNIVLAGLLALGPTLLVVRFVEHLLASGVVSGAKLHLTDKAIISVTTFFADVLFDVAIYYLLHWAANHWRRRGHDRLEDIAEAAREQVPFFKDATKVQLQRMVLSPLLYVIFLGTQFTLMAMYHERAVYATLVGFLTATAVARTLHTLWMLREERRKRAAFAAHPRCVKCGRDRTGLSGLTACPQCGFIPQKLTGTESEQKIRKPPAA